MRGDESKASPLMGKAAELLSISQSSVSKAIAEIEHTIGVRLLDRTPKGVAITAYGRALLRRGIGAFHALDFLVRLTDEDVPLDEALNTLSAFAEQFQSGAIVGGTLIDSSSATFDRVVYPSLLVSPFSMAHSLIAPAATAPQSWAKSALSTMRLVVSGSYRISPR